MFGSHGDRHDLRLPLQSSILCSAALFRLPLELAPLPSPRSNLVDPCCERERNTVLKSHVGFAYPSHSATVTYCFFLPVAGSHAQNDQCYLSPCPDGIAAEERPRSRAPLMGARCVRCGDGRRALVIGIDDECAVDHGDEEALGMCPPF